MTGFTKIDTLISVQGAYPIRITEGETGGILSQKHLASGLGRTTDAPQHLHLLIDGLEQNVLGIGSGFVSYI